MNLFKITCLKCNSENIKIECSTWTETVYPYAETTLICKNCKAQEDLENEE